MMTMIVVVFMIMTKMAIPNTTTMLTMRMAMLVDNKRLQQ
jgi:hypothetical protein